MIVIWILSQFGDGFEAQIVGDLEFSAVLSFGEMNLKFTVQILLFLSFCLLAGQCNEGCLRYFQVLEDGN